jgi:DNA-binding transcriptional LysR family regulator
MDRFRELSIFVAVAEEGAFNAAARRLNLTPPVVTRLVTALETRLGVRLLTRTTRKVALTEAGARLLGDAARVLADLDEVEAIAAGAHSTPRGLLRITAPVLFGQKYVLPVLREFLDSYPDVSASTLFVDRVVDLIDEGLDVALRIGELPDSSLTATRIGMVRRVTVAAPEYLAEHGMPETPDDLAGHKTIQPAGLQDSVQWPFVAAGKTRIARLSPRLTVNTVTAAIGSAMAGWGVTRALSYQVADAIADGSLVEILRDWEDREMPIHLVHHEGRLSAAKTRVFIDFAAQRLRAQADQLAAL